MAYEPTQWKAGDTVTSAKLNKIEQGIAGGANILIAHATEEVVDNKDSSGTVVSRTTMSKLDKTVREILDADFTIVIVDVPAEVETTIVQQCAYVAGIQINPDTEAYQVYALTSNTPFIALTEDDYPAQILFEEEVSSDNTSQA